MIKEKLPFVKKILAEHPRTRGDGYGTFLNTIVKELYGDKQVDFNVFNAGSYMRARRKVLEMNPELDERTVGTKIAEDTLCAEMIRYD